MGQAFDGDGRVLGEAFGETKREVFDKLNKAHQDAAEIRIRSLGAQTEMPRYKSHKEVWALKIAEVIDPTVGENESDGSQMLRFENQNYAHRHVSGKYVRKHSPVAGGYFVVYKDGYESFSPAEAFEDGYSPVSPS